MGTDVHAVVQAKRDGKWEAVESKWEQDRHYLLFSWLANVRNGFGFAGVPTYDPIEPIAPRRGIPADFDKDAYEAGDEDAPWLGDHSFSWLTADEILAAKRPGGVQRTGVVTVEQFKAWDGKSRPESHCGGVAGGGVVVANHPSKITPATTHVQIEWTDEGDGLDYFVDEVRRLKEQHGEVRLVFGFDS